MDFLWILLWLDLVAKVLIATCRPQPEDNLLRVGLARRLRCPVGVHDGRKLLEFRKFQVVELGKLFRKQNKQEKLRRGSIRERERVGAWILS